MTFDGGRAVGGHLTARGREDTLHWRSVYRAKIALHGLRCHPLASMLLKIHVVKNSSRTKLASVAI